MFIKFIKFIRCFKATRGSQQDFEAQSFWAILDQIIKANMMALKKCPLASSVLRENEVK